MTPIPYGRQLIEEDDIEAVTRVLRSDRLTQGPEVEAFEEELAAYTGYKHCVCVANGTMALELACVAAGVKPGSTGITSAITFKASASCLWRLKADAWLVDIDPETWNGVFPEYDRDTAQQRKLAVAIPVDFAGLPCRLPALGTPVVRDACHSLGADITGADMACLSFHPIKAITTGEGGAILTNEDKYALALHSLRHHCLGKNEHAGYNARMNELSAALGRSQLKKIDSFIYRRRTIANYYRMELEDVEGVKFQGGNLKQHAYHLFIIWMDPKLYNRAKVGLELLIKYRIDTQSHYKPLAPLPNAKVYYEGALSIPIYPAMTNQDVEFVMASLKKVLADVKGKL